MTMKTTAEYPVVDAHVHLPTFDGLHSLQEKRIRLLQDLKEDGVDRCILISDSELESSIGSMEECVGLFDADENVRVVAGISPLIGFDAQLARLSGYLADGKVCGIKLFPGHERFYLSDPALEPVWRLAERYGVPVLFHSGWENSGFASPGIVRAAAETHPSLRLVCCHCFYPDLWECLQMTDLPHLLFDLSSVADDPTRMEELIPAVSELIRAVPDRVLFGSDYASCERAPHLRMMEQLELSAEERRKVLSDNALSLYFMENS